MTDPVTPPPGAKTLARTIKPTPIAEWTIVGVLAGTLLLAFAIVHVLDRIADKSAVIPDIPHWLGLGLIGTIVVLAFGAGIFGTKYCGSISADFLGSRFDLGDHEPPLPEGPDHG